MSTIGQLFEPSEGLVRPLTGRSSLLVCSLASVKAKLGIADAVTSSDAAITAWITTVGDVFATVGLARAFWRQRWQEQLSGDGGQYLLPGNWPIERIVTITYGVDSPETVDAADYSIVSSRPSGGALGSRERIFRADGWEFTPEPAPPRRFGDRALPYAVDYIAGWLMTDEVATWSALAAKSLGDWARPTSASALYRYECTTAGATGAAEPAWPTTEAATVTDGSVVWTCRGAAEVPVPVQQAATIQAAAWYEGALDLPVGIQEEEHEDHRVRYDFTGLRDGVPALLPTVQALLRPYR